MNPEDKLDVVFDCNTFLQGTVRKTGPAFACLQSFLNDEFTLHYSSDILDEVSNVLSRPALQQKFDALTPAVVEELLQSITTKAVLTTNIPAEFLYERDPKDEPYINLAIVVKAHYIVSRDTDLLDLLDNRRADGKAFLHRYPFLKIVDPAAFLVILAQRSKNE